MSVNLSASASEIIPLARPYEGYGSAENSVDRNPKIIKVVSQIFRNEMPVEKRCCRIATHIAKGLWASSALVVGSWYAGNVILELPCKFMRKFFLLGALPFGIFPAHHALEIVGEWTKPRTTDEQELRNRHFSLIKRCAKGGFVFLWAITTQLGVPIIVHTSHPKYGARGVALDSLITIFSCLAPSLRSAGKLTEKVYDAIYLICKRFSADKEFLDLFQIRKNIIEGITANIDRGMPMSVAERVAKFDKMYEAACFETLSPGMEEIKQEFVQVERLLKQLLMPSSEYSRAAIEAPKWYELSSHALGVITAIIAVVIYDVAISGCLAAETAALMTDSRALQYFMAFSVVLCWFYLSMVGPASGYQKLYGQIVDSVGVDRNSCKTFAEQYYPEATKMLSLLGFMIAAWGIPEMMLVAQNCFNKETTSGNVLIALECYSLIGFFINSICSLIEDTVKTFAASSYSSPEKRHAIEFMNKCHRIREVFENLSPPDLQEWLDSIEDEELKNYLLGRDINFDLSLN